MVFDLKNTILLQVNGQCATFFTVFGFVLQRPLESKLCQTLVEFLRNRAFSQVFVFSACSKQLDVEFFTFDRRQDCIWQRNNFQLNRLSSSFTTALRLGLHLDVFWGEKGCPLAKVTTCAKISYVKVSPMNFRLGNLDQGCQRLRPVKYLLFVWRKIYPKRSNRTESLQNLSANQGQRNFFICFAKYSMAKRGYVITAPHMESEFGAIQLDMVTVRSRSATVYRNIAKFCTVHGLDGSSNAFLIRSNFVDSTHQNTVTRKCGTRCFQAMCTVLTS